MGDRRCGWPALVSPRQGPSGSPFVWLFAVGPDDKEGWVDFSHVYAPSTQISPFMGTIQLVWEWLESHLARQKRMHVFIFTDAELRDVSLCKAELVMYLSRAMHRSRLDFGACVGDPGVDLYLA